VIALAEVYMLESGTGLPGKCNNNATMPGGTFAASNLFTPGILIFNSDGGSQFKNPANAPLVQIPGTGTIWRISRSNGGGDDDD
jgi:hypothetical protein